MPSVGFVCQGCGIEAPSKYVEFYYNIGALVMRFHRGVKGNLCKSCIHKQFWKCTVIDVTLGWWGVISVVVTPIFLINNVIRYIGAMPLPAPGPGAAPPRLSNEDLAKAATFRQELVTRVNQNEPLATVLPDIARRTGLSPGQILLYLRKLSQPAPPPLPQAKDSPVVMNPAVPQAAAPLPALPVEPVEPAPAVEQSEPAPPDPQKPQPLLDI